MNKAPGAGTVYLVGAGPGDPGLLTLRGAECIRRADVIVYDRLAHPDLLKHAAESAELTYVGKESAHHVMRQEEINQLLVDRSLAGKTVCRLKGGDPFVFGRGGEEAEACFEAGVPFEIVPGITSAIAGPAYAGIPVTHRSIASSFSVITGHEDPEKVESRIRWEHLAFGTDTLIFLMGVENLPLIVERLLAFGMPPDTAIALVRWATWPQQETLISTLANVVQEVRESEFKAPAVTIVGEVVNLREKLRWYDRKPLFGKRILVTRAREQASALSDLLRERGADPVEFPLIRIKPMKDFAFLDDALKSLETYRWVVFTSANAVRVVWERLLLMGRDARRLAPCRIAAVGPATADALGAIGLRADFIPSESIAESVIEEWPDRDLSGCKILLPRAKQAREVIPERLGEMGAIVDVVAAYQTVIDSEGAEAIRAQLEGREIDAITFTSSSTVTNFGESIGKTESARLLDGLLVASIGPITSQAARDAGIRVDVEAEDHSIPGLVRAVEDHLAVKG